MSKTIKMDLRSVRILSAAYRLHEDENYLDTLRLLNKNADLWGNNPDSYMLYAETFEDIGLYEQSINYWFRYLDNAEEPEDYADCYEGLATCFMNIGNDRSSAYYYNKLLRERGDLDDDIKEDIIADFFSDTESPLKFVWPPHLADASETITNGIGHMKDNNFDAAIEEFEKVGEGNKSYSSARNYIAMCKIITDKTDEAEMECRKILKKNPSDVQALTTLAAVMTEKGRTEEAHELAELLVSMKDVTDEERYKIATVCCENKMHAEAYKLFCGLSDDVKYDLTINFFKAISAFNCGKYNESFSTFNKILAIYPEAIAAKYWYNYAWNLHENGETEELSYFYRLPTKERENSLKMLAAYVRLPATSVRKLGMELDITDCILWAFDEGEAGSGYELKALAARAAIKAEMDGYVRDLLLNASLPDNLKIEMLVQLAERNEENGFGVVICDIYKMVFTDKLKLGRAKRRHFLSAYAGLAAHFGIIDENYPHRFAAEIEKLYSEMEEREILELSKDENALAAAAYMRAGITGIELGGRTVYQFFNVTEEQVKIITGEV